MTGLWQIAGRADLSFDDLVRLDFYYLENWSIWLDISVLVKTDARGRGSARGLLTAFGGHRRLRAGEGLGRLLRSLAGRTLR